MICWTLHLFFLFFTLSILILTKSPGINAKPSSLSESVDDDRTPRCSDCKWSQHWELQSRLNLSGVLPVYKYKSKRTGLSVVLAQADSPIVNGYFCLATEAWNEDGLPHTLEHLIFLGR